MKKALTYQKKHINANTSGETVIKILIYLQFLFQIFVCNVNVNTRSVVTTGQGGYDTSGAESLGGTEMS